MPSNGKYGADDLTPINGPNGSADQLAKGGPGAGWNAMCHEAKRRGLAIPYPTGPDSSYRSYDEQVYYYELYLSGEGNLAAYPGTSNHGYGSAVDVATTAGVSTVKAIGGSFGWWWGEAPSEWWHVTGSSSYGGSNPGPVDQSSKVTPLQRGDKGGDVRDMQARIKRLGYHPLKDEYSEGRFGSQTEQVVKRFQKNAGLAVDGVVGDKTYDKIKDRLHTVDRLNLTENEDHWVDLFYREHGDDDLRRLRDQMETIYDCAEPNDWDVHDRRIRYDTLNQIANKHGKLHVA